MAQLIGFCFLIGKRAMNYLRQIFGHFKKAIQLL